MWARGGPSDTLSSAGVVVRLFDYSSDKDQPWLNCDKTSCSYGDRLTGTIINARLPDVYDLWDSWNYGVVLSSSSLKLRCLYSRDGFTFNIPNDGCPTPDCDANCGVYFCKQTSEELWWKCGWRGDQLKAMLTMHARLRHNGAFRIGGNEVTYNEVVIDTAGYFGTMPRSVAAFFYTAKANPEQRASARKAHERFLAKYGGLAKGTPLLVYDSSKRGEPFSTAEAGE